MTTTLLSSQTPVVRLTEQLHFPEAGILSKILIQDAHCQQTLFCVAQGGELSEHTATRNATVQVLVGTGTMQVNGETVPLEPGVLLFMPAHTPHALQATSDLAFLLTLSATS